ncbi:hypothetical protein GUJ93_ZPchr0010g9920 [Zizania palustris]|uniref:Uncharacterized protein n=1 Tax=Zizania palustris TaxID=103762 RepID=A0A8J5W9E1_ZIZPA|nr:hypothetical protein GUJ93_ZPchr0010g9920 [Zizania palustris]
MGLRPVCLCANCHAGQDSSWILERTDNSSAVTGLHLRTDRNGTYRYTSCFFLLYSDSTAQYSFLLSVCNGTALAKNDTLQKFLTPTQQKHSDILLLSAIFY